MDASSGNLLANAITSITGLTKIISGLAESIEQAILAGLRSKDTIRRARERKRIRNLATLSGELFTGQSFWTSRLREFGESMGEEHGELTWDAVKYEILSIQEMIKKVEKYVLPSNDLLLEDYKGRYLEILRLLGDRKRILDIVSAMSFEDACNNADQLQSLGREYEKLIQQLSDIVDATLGRLMEVEKELPELRGKLEKL